MTVTRNQPALVTTLTAGDAIANGGTTPAAAGVTWTVATSAGGTVTWQTDRWRCVGNAGVARFDEAVAANAATVDDLWNIPSWPTGSANRLYEIRHASNYMCRIEQNTNGTLVVLNATNAAVWTSAAVPTGLVRIAITVDPDTSTTGAFSIDIFTTDPETSTTPDQSWDSTTMNLGTAAVAAIRRGRISSTAASAATAEILYGQTDDTGATIGPLAPDVDPPSISAPDETEPWVADFRSSGTAGGGGDLSWSIAHVSGPDNTAGVEEPVDGLFLIPRDTTTSVYRVTLTETGNAETDTWDVTVTPAGTDLEGLVTLVRVGGVYV